MPCRKVLPIIVDYNKTFYYHNASEMDNWYGRIDPKFAESSLISEAIMDQIIHNSYDVLIAGNVTMRKRHGFNASAGGKAGERNDWL